MQEGSLAQPTVETWAAVVFLMFCLGCWIKRHGVFMAPLWMALSWKGSHSTQVTDATHGSVNVRLEQIAYQSEGKCSQCTYSSKNNKAGLSSLAHERTASTQTQSETATVPNSRSPPLMLRNVFHFQRVSFVFPSWANPDDATTHMGPLWEKLWVRQTGASRKTHR